MKFQAIQTAIRTRVNTITLINGFTFEYDNNLSPADSEPTDKTVRVTIMHGDSQKTTIPGNGVRVTGVVMLALFVSVSSGDRLVSEVADQLASALSNISFDYQTGRQVIFRSASLQRVGRDNTFFQMNVSVPWFADVEP